MTILNRDQIISVGHSLPAIFEFMEADSVTVELAHHHITGEPRATLDPKGNTLTVITKHGEVEIFSHKYNNFLPQNLIAIHF